MPFASPEISVRRCSEQLWELMYPLIYHGNDESWVVPTGFKTDFASVPAIVTWLVPKYGTYTLAAVLHDWFCDHGIRDGVINGRDTDGIFRRIMRELGVPPVRRWLIWTGVRWGALFNPIRREDWHKDAPAVLVISLLALPFVAPAGVLAAISLLVYALVEGIVSLFRRA